LQETYLALIPKEVCSACFTDSSAEAERDKVTKSPEKVVEAENFLRKKGVF
jgi:hypothetical protein